MLNEESKKRFLSWIKKMEEKNRIEEEAYSYWNKDYDDNIIMDAITNRECYPSFDEFMDWLDEVDSFPKSEQRFMLINIQKMFRDAQMPKRAMLTNYKLNKL